MAGRIRDDDISLVRERANIVEIVGAYVNLKRAGGDHWNGLCPFHDERTPSFGVTPSRGLYYCFGCGEGGDVIRFLERMENVAFSETVELLAGRVGVVLRYTDGGGSGIEPGLRQQILQANRLAAEYFAEHLSHPDAARGRQFLEEREFNLADAAGFGVGFAPRGGRELGNWLKSRGFNETTLIKAGLVRGSGGWDYFQSRLIWPIRDSSASVLGFGARRIFDDDRMPAKYLNTPDTPVYHKAQVLYGLDLARQQIGKRAQAVVVEGYTDVMAAHLSGVDTAVASCGTAFGANHARLLQRLLGGDAFHGEVIFTFDGDAAGQAAALKVFSGDQHFSSQTYVAVAAEGMDPCELRQHHGAAAVRELVASRIPLYRFVMNNLVNQFDLDRVDGRINALRAAAPLVGSVRDRSMVDGYARELAGILGADVDDVRREVQRAARRGRLPGESQQPTSSPAQSGVPWPDPADRRLEVERGTAKLVVQNPMLFAQPGWSGIEPEDFTHPAYRDLLAAATAAIEIDGEWVHAILSATTDETVRRLVVALGVEPPLRDPDQTYAQTYVAKLKLLTVNRQITELKSRLQRTNPVDQQSEYNALFSQLLTLESQRQQFSALSLSSRM